MVGGEGKVHQYLEGTIQAILPVYDQDGSGTIVCTRRDEFRDKRSLPWLVYRLAHYYNLDLAILRKRSGVLLKQKHHLSLPLNSDLVLLPIKIRRAAEHGETTIAYINLHQIERLEEIGDGLPYRSMVVFQGGRILKSLYTVSTLRERVRQGELVQGDFVGRNKRMVAMAGLDSAELISALPGCTCFLKDLFLAVVTLADKVETID